MRGEAPILVVDDEPAIRRLVCRALERSGFAVREAEDAAGALRAVDAFAPELVLLDLGLPDRDGLELIPTLRGKGISVLVLTARDEVAEKVTALDLGADDYVTKPFDTEELLARVRTGLRHRHAAWGKKERVQTGGLLVDLNARIVRRNGEEVHLTPKEYALLAELARNAGRVVTHARLLSKVWGSAHEQDVEYLRVAIRSLRLKIEKDPGDPMLVRNEPGVGYRLVEQA
jgi:two-component system KDP operon response regulator KdpE